MAGGEVARIERGLGGGAEDDRAAVVAREFVERLRARREQRARQGLRFVEDDDAAGDIVQLAAARGARGEQALEELHIGGDDDRRGPVLHGELELVLVGHRAVGVPRVRPPLVLDGRMMLQHDLVAQHAAEDRGGLVDDGGERDGVDDPLVAVRLGVVKGEAERGERLAAAGRHRQREEAGRIAGARTHMIEDFGAQAVDRRIRIAHFAHMPVEGIDQTGQEGLQRGPFAVDLASLDPRVELLGILEIGIHEAREDHPSQEGELKRRFRSGLSAPIERAGNRPVTSGTISDFQTAIERRFRKAFEALGQRGEGFALFVGQPGMMPGNRIRDQFGDKPVIGLRCFRQLLHDGRAGGRMIDPLLGTGEPSLKRRRIFPEIMQQARQQRCFRCAEFGAAAPRSVSHFCEVIGQLLPVGSIQPACRMGKIHA